jgi:hypothetical protein
MFVNILKTLVPLETETLTAAEMICHLGILPDGTRATCDVCHVDGTCDICDARV